VTLASLLVAFGAAVELARRLLRLVDAFLDAKKRKEIQHDEKVIADIASARPGDRIDLDSFRVRDDSAKK